MSDRETRKKELLKELGDVQSLLDDKEARPAPSTTGPGSLEREQIRKLASERHNPFLGSPPPGPPPRILSAPAVMAPSPLGYSPARL